jgi:hypothetical protein
MTSGIPKILPTCKRCGKSKAVKYYCPACSKIVELEKKNKWRRKNLPLGMLINPGIKRAPSITIIDDPLPVGGFPPGTTFTGNVEIISMLTNFSFTNNTIVESHGRRLKIVNGKFLECV